MPEASPTTPPVRRPRIAAAVLAVVLGAAGAVAMPTAAFAADVTVTLTTDTGVPGEFRYEVENSDPGDRILFDPTVFGVHQDIFIADDVTISHSLEIVGPGRSLVSIIRANDGTVAFNQLVVDNAAPLGTDVTISGITLDGRIDGVLPATTNGSGIYSDTTSLNDLTLTDVGIYYQIAASGAGLFVDQAQGDISITDTAMNTNEAEDFFGGAIALTQINGNVTLTDFEAISNISETAGAAVYAGVVGGTFTVTGAHVSSNMTEGAGGGFYLLAIQGAVSIAGTVSVNDAESAGSIYGTQLGSFEYTGSMTGNEALGGDGGAMVLEEFSGNINIHDSYISGNQTPGNGGALNLSDFGALTVTNVEFPGNDAGTDGTGSGGAIYADGVFSPASITGSLFSGNTAANSGGAIWVDRLSQSLTIGTSTFAVNSADLDGGGGLHIGQIFAPGTLTVDSSTFRGNDAGSGGVSVRVVLNLGVARIVNSTFSETDGPQAIWFEDHANELTIANSTIVGVVAAAIANDGAVLVTHSILVGTGGSALLVDSVGVDTPIPVEWSILSSAFSPFDVQDLGDNMFSTDPDLGALADNGGPTETMLPNVGSPAIDNGDPAFTAPPSLDQRGSGFLRIQHGRVDIGAVEIQVPELAETGQTVSWWLLFVAGGVLALGIAALLLTRRRKTPRH